MDVFPDGWSDVVNTAERDVVRHIRDLLLHEPTAHIAVSTLLSGTEQEADAILVWRGGVFAVEVKAWGVAKLRELLHRGANSKRVGGESNPGDQAWRRAMHIKELCWRRHGLSVHVERRIALPNLTRNETDLSDYDLQDLGWSSGGRCLVIWGDDLENPTHLRHILTLDQGQLDEPCVDKIWRAVKGHIQRSQPAFDFLAGPGGRRLLRKQQIKVADWDPARTAGRQGLVVRGSAGSGKTVIALHRAWRAAGSGRSVLFACCNASLMHKISEVVGREETLGDLIEVSSAPSALLRHFGQPCPDEGLDLDEVVREVSRLLEDSYGQELADLYRDRGDPAEPWLVAREVLDAWACGAQTVDEYRRWSRRAGRFLDPKDEDFYEFNWDLAQTASRRAKCAACASVLRACAALGSSQRPKEPLRVFDEIVIDEAQDAYPAWLIGLTRLLSADGRMVVLYDRAQAVHRVAVPIEEALRDTGIAFEHYVLNHSFRCPSDVSEWYGQLPHLDEVFDHERREYQDWEEHFTIESSVDGLYLYPVAGHSGGLTGVSRLAEECPGTLAVVYLGRGPGFGERDEELELQLGSAAGRDDIVLSPLGGLRGLEFDQVVIYGFNSDFPPDDIHDETRSQLRRMFLVAATRVRERLSAVYWTPEPSAFVREIDQAGRPHPTAAQRR